MDAEFDVDEVCFHSQMERVFVCDVVGAEDVYFPAQEELTT